jgi:hypothetical protein
MVRRLRHSIRARAHIGRSLLQHLQVHAEATVRCAGLAAEGEKEPSLRTVGTMLCCARHPEPV